MQLLWTEARKRNVSLTTVSKLLSEGPAKLCRLTKKGGIELGKDADLIVFDPDEETIIKEEDILHKHKITPYLGKSVQGTVIRTIVRGSTVYQKDGDFPPPMGKFIFAGGRKQS